MGLVTRLFQSRTDQQQKAQGDAEGKCLRVQKQGKQGHPFSNAFQWGKSGVLPKEKILPTKRKNETMSKPKNMTPEQEADWRQKQREYMRNWESKTENIQKKKERGKKRYADKRDRILDLNSKWRDANQEKVKHLNRKWRDENRAKILELERKRKAANPERFREKDRKWASENKQKVTENSRRWRAANPEKARKVSRKYRESNLKKVCEIQRKCRERKRIQAAADQFFQLAKTAEQITEYFQQQNSTNDNDSNTDSK
jgi:hypothetical protein